MSVESTGTRGKKGAANYQKKEICEHIKLTKKTWDFEQNKCQEGKLYRGRPQRLNTEQAREHRGALRLQGNRCYITETITPSSDISAARRAKQDFCDKQTTVLRHESGTSNDYTVPKADEILVELHKILVFRDKDPFINAVCSKRRSKPKGTERKFSREQRRVQVKNAYFRKTTMTAGELALDKGKAANSSKQVRARNNAQDSSETSKERDKESCTGAERLETKSIELFNKEPSHGSGE